MAGTLTISTLSDGTNSTSSTNCIQGSAKAWVQFSGTGASPATINASYNVSSVTRQSTGNYTINFTNAFSDNKYVITSAPWLLVGTNRYVVEYVTASTTNLTVFISAGYAGAAADPANNSIAIFR